MLLIARYQQVQEITKAILNRKNYIPKLPLDGKFDFTYRCNNNCRHCWLWLSPDAIERHEELSFEEIQRIVVEARKMGTQAWSISGGEPMLRTDFYEIFDFITRKSVYYTLNTNGTLITPKIAQLLKRKGRKMVAIYGATADVHDHITRNEGSFEATMRGISFLKEAGAFFTVQIIPMRENYHQYQAMLELAESLSKDFRVGATWLYLSAYHLENKNCEILNQRLDPSDVVDLEQPVPVNQLLCNPSENETTDNLNCFNNEKDNRLFASCITSRRDFHIDPYGLISFCPFVKDPTMRFDLRKGSFEEAWNEFIPSLKDVVHGGQEYLENCGSCDLRQDCHWCPVYSYLEHGRYSARVDYLCNIAKETQKFKEDWMKNHTLYFEIAGITIMVYSKIPITEKTFIPAFQNFKVDEPGDDFISIQLVPTVPSKSELHLGQEVLHRPPWAIYRQRDSWVYMSIPPEIYNKDPNLVAIFNEDHSRATIFNKNFYEGVENLPSLTTFTTDQILLARILADRQACYLHSAGMNIDGLGYLFVGHSDAGKSTMMKLLRGRGEILGDDRNIVRRWPDGFRVHGTWSHGELPDVSSVSAPLRGIFYIEQAESNEIIPIKNKQEHLGKFLSHVIRALVNDDWWEKILVLAGEITREVPAFRLKFDKSGRVMDVLNEFIESNLYQNQN